MRHHPGLVQRGTRWYIRRAVPTDLVEFLARKGEIWRSLHTGDHGQAVKRFRRASAELDAWFDEQRLRLHQGLAADERLTRIAVRTVREEDLRAARWDTLSVCQEEAIGEAGQDLFDLANGALEEEVSRIVSKLMAGTGARMVPHTVGTIKTSLPVPAEPVPGQVEELARRVTLELAQRRLARLRGSPAVHFDPLLKPVSGLTLSELIERFERDRIPGVGKSKITEYRAAFRLLREAWGSDKPVREIDRADCRKVRDMVAELPPNATKRWPRKTLAQVIELARREGIEPIGVNTRNAYMTRMSTLLEWAAREELIDKNPAKGLLFAADQDPRDARRPFSIEQLRLIFAASPFVPRDDQGALFWAPLISLFGGLRLGEICQLQTEDVTTRDGVPVILVRPAPDGRLKTKAARRTVPVHPELVRIGLMDFAARQLKEGHARLFPDLAVDHRGYRTNAIQKALNRQIERAGAKGERQSFHSLRHTWRDALREGGVSRDAVLAMGGWKSGGTEELYGGGLRPSTLAREIAKVRYPSLDLSHLRPR